MSYKKYQQCPFNMFSSQQNVWRCVGNKTSHQRISHSSEFADNNEKKDHIQLSTNLQVYSNYQSINISSKESETMEDGTHYSDKLTIFDILGRPQITRVTVWPLKRPNQPNSAFFETVCQKQTGFSIWSFFGLF